MNYDAPFYDAICMLFASFAKPLLAWVVCKEIYFLQLMQMSFLWLALIICSVHYMYTQHKKTRDTHCEYLSLKLSLCLSAYRLSGSIWK